MSDRAPDAALLQEWARGELSPNEAFARLYDLHAAVVHTWLAIREPAAADDLFQDVWTIFYRRCREWEHRQEMSDLDARPVLGFLFRTCELVLLAHRRMQARRRPEPLDSIEAPAVDGQRRAFEAVQLGECLDAARRHCSDEECAVLMAKLAGVPAREISRALRITESAVDHKFRNAVARIREVLSLPRAKDSLAEASVDARLLEEWRDTIDATSLPPASTLAGQADSAAASRAAIIAELEDVQWSAAELRASLDVLQAATLATRRWTMRDVVAHLASWSWQTRVEAERLLEEQLFDEIIAFGVDGPHAWNQREVDARIGRSLAELFDEIDFEHQRLIEIVASSPATWVAQFVELPRTIGDPPKPWRMSFGAMILMSCRHARLHLGRLARIAKGE